MIRAASKTKDGGTLVFLGVTPGSLRRLRDGQPILVDCEPLGLPGVKVTIVFGQTERSIVAELRALGVEVPGADEVLRDVEAEHRAKGTTP